MKETLMVLNGANPVHAAYADAIGADRTTITGRVTKRQFAPLKAFRLLKNSLSIPRGYRNILCESCYYYPAIKKRLIGLDSRIININCGPLYYHLLSGRIAGLEKRMLLSLKDEIYAHMVQGEYGMELAERFDPGKPAAITYPFIADEIYGKLFGMKPKTRANEVTILATNDSLYKGVDIAIEAFNKLIEYDDGLALNVVGNIPADKLQEFDKKQSGKIRYLGYVEDICEVIGRSALYLMPSRGESFGVAALEAMAGGVPAIVSRESGVREVVGKVDPEMICKLDADDLAERIIRYLSLSGSEREKRSVAMRKAVRHFTRKEQVDNFKKQFEMLVAR